jgi:hypothetical protein
MKKSVITLAIGLTFSTINTSGALADQCSFVTKAQAIAAFQNLSIGQTIYEFCELCGDRTARPVVIQSLNLKNTNSPGYWQILVNGKGIDLAYTYIDYQDSGRRRINLALTANCPAADFTPLLSSP